MKQNTTLDIVYQQKIVEQDYDIVVSLKRVDYKKNCLESYQFEMKVIEKQQDKFILKIQKYNCLSRVEIQWFAHSYEIGSVNQTAYFREQVYQKNMKIKGNKTLSQDYLFDQKKKNRDVLPLFTGFQLYPNNRIELNTNNVLNRRTYKIIQTTLKITDYEQEIKEKQVQFTMSFLISHPDIFKCEKGLDYSFKSEEKTFILQNIEYLDTTQVSQQGKQVVCYFKQYNSSFDQQLQSEYTPLINPIYYYIDGKFTNTDQEEKEEEKIDNENKTEEKAEPQKNKEEQFELYQIIFIVIAVLSLISGLIFKLHKQYKESNQQIIYNQQQSTSQNVSPHFELQED